MLGYFITSAVLETDAPVCECDADSTYVISPVDEDVAEEMPVTTLTAVSVLASVSNFVLLPYECVWLLDAAELVTSLVVASEVTAFVLPDVDGVTVMVGSAAVAHI